MSEDLWNMKVSSRFSLFFFFFPEGDIGVSYYHPQQTSKGIAVFKDLQRSNG